VHLDGEVGTSTQVGHGVVEVVIDAAVLRDRVLQARGIPPQGARRESQPVTS
jgi:hypothetical protein